MISKKTKYAIKALVALARNGGEAPMTILEISDQEKIPKKFLETILLDLRKQGILKSKIGIGGGYYLLMKPKDIMLSRVLRNIDGPIAMVPCVSLNFYERCDDCTDEVTCGIRQAFIEVRDATLKILSETSLEDILKKEDRLKALKKKGR
ncbi:MAG TPA: Rrf2 family transcriptional regulator [Bacteroidia bacterium]|nr:Rrf2 family transcriptional regulator [Bacteroidia bacterium]